MELFGYIYQTYVTEAPPIQIEKIDLSIDNTTLQKGESKSLQVTIQPKEAEGHKVEFTSSDPNIVTVDNKGNLRAIRSGSSIITVKAAENNVQSQIEINVYSKVTGISLDQDEIYMQVGDNFKINAFAEPDDANDPSIIYESSDEGVAEVGETGMITAKQIGEAYMTASSKESPEIKAVCKVFVVRKMEDSEIHFDSSLNVESLEVSGVDYDENTVLDIKDKITTDLEIEIVNYEGKVLEDTDIVGTGSKILVKEDGKILRVYQIIIYGDADGDGKINSIDLLVIQRHILGIKEIDPIFKKSSDVGKTGKKPTSVDLLLIQRHILGIKIIDQ